MSNIKQKLRREKMRSGTAHFYGESETIAAQSDVITSQNEFLGSISNGSNGQSETRSISVDPVDNEDPTKPHIRRFRPIGWFKRHISQIRRFWKPDPTPAEEELIEQQRRNRAIYRVMIGEMMVADKRLSQAYANLGFEYVRKNKSKYEQAKPVRVTFSKWLYSTDGNTIYGKVSKVPYGVNPARLVDKEVLTALSVSVGHPVGGQIGDNGEGIHIYISLAGRNDFVDSILFRSMLPKVPKDALPLTFICGATKNGGREWRSLESLPHFMGAGETGGGKTNFMHCMVCTFISRNKADDVRLAMIDLKFGGVALNRYQGIPHLVSIPDRDGMKGVPNGIANDIPSAVSVLRWAFEESTRRGELFLSDVKHHPQKIEEWNKYHKTKHLPRLVIFIDELALLMDKSDVDSKIEMIDIKLARYFIKQILRLARSSGVHLCGFTQSLDKSVMGVAFKTNVSGRLCFSVADVMSSILVVGDGMAVNLQPAGRAIYKRGTDKFMVQTPLITEADITECISNAKSGKVATEFSSQAVTPEALIRFAVEEGNYNLSQVALLDHFKGQISFNDLVKRMLPGMDNNDYEIDEVVYTVIPPHGAFGRKVERKDAHL